MLECWVTISPTSYWCCHYRVGSGGVCVLLDGECVRRYVICVVVVSSCVVFVSYSDCAGCCVDVDVVGFYTACCGMVSVCGECVWMWCL